MTRLGRAFDPSPKASWEPLLPLPFAPDVAEAQRQLQRGALGAIRQIYLTCYFGAVEPMGFDPPELPGDTVEAAVWGLDLAESLASGSVSQTRWLAPPSDDGGGIAHHAVADIPVVQSVLPASAGPLTPFEARIVASRGTIWLRMPFAAGSPVVLSGRSFLIPTMAEARTPFHEPDSYPGGLELRSARQRVAQDADGRVSRQAHALRLFTHIQASLGETND
jgi:hypothetical protein